MSDILQHREDGILTLTFNRLDKKNAITTVMYNALADAMFAAAEDAAVRVVVLQGHEQVFTAGNDLADFLKNPPDTSKPDAEPAPVVRFLEALRTFGAEWEGDGLHLLAPVDVLSRLVLLDKPFMATFLEVDGVGTLYLVGAFSSNAPPRVIVNGSEWIQI